jgi:rSAM/selenodomain-associated transferase 1
VKSAVGLIAKVPEAGRVKTRLCPPLTPSEAAELAAAMLTDTLASAGSSGADPWCVYDGDERLLTGHLRLPVSLLRQTCGGLEARLAAAQAELFAHGYDRVLLVGADCPSVSSVYLRQAIDALFDVDLVLGPAFDGGYTLIGTNAPSPALFDGVLMSTDHVLIETLGRAVQQRLQVRLLAWRYDLDTVGDLVEAHASGQLAHATATLAALDTLRLAPPAVKIFCSGCGRPEDTDREVQGGAFEHHQGCKRRVALDPPRFCAICGFRLDVQVYPAHVETSCRECRRRARFMAGTQAT